MDITGGGAISILLIPGCSWEGSILQCFVCLRGGGWECVSAYWGRSVFLALVGWICGVASRDSSAADFLEMGSVSVWGYNEAIGWRCYAHSCESPKGSNRASLELMPPRAAQEPRQGGGFGEERQSHLICGFSKAPMPRCGNREAKANRTTCHPSPRTVETAVARRLSPRWLTSSEPTTGLNIMFGSWYFWRVTPGHECHGGCLTGKIRLPGTQRAEMLQCDKVAAGGDGSPSHRSLLPTLVLTVGCTPKASLSGRQTDIAPPLILLPQTNRHMSRILNRVRPNKQTQRYLLPLRKTNNNLGNLVRKRRLLPMQLP